MISDALMSTHDQLESNIAFHESEINVLLTRDLKDHSVLHNYGNTVSQLQLLRVCKLILRKYHAIY